MSGHVQRAAHGIHALDGRARQVGELLAEDDVVAGILSSVSVGVDELELQGRGLERELLRAPDVRNRARCRPLPGPPAPPRANGPHHGSGGRERYGGDRRRQRHHDDRPRHELSVHAFLLSLSSECFVHEQAPYARPPDEANTQRARRLPGDAVPCGMMPTDDRGDLGSRPPGAGAHVAGLNHRAQASGRGNRLQARHTDAQNHHAGGLDRAGRRHQHGEKALVLVDAIGWILIAGGVFVLLFGGFRFRRVSALIGSMSRRIAPGD